LSTSCTSSARFIDGSILLRNTFVLLLFEVALRWGHAVRKHVEEKIGFYTFHNGSSLISLLVLLLLLNLLFSRVLGLIGQGDRCAFDAFDLVLCVGVGDELDVEDHLGEVFVVRKVEPHAERLAGVPWDGQDALGVDVYQVGLENGVVVLLDELVFHLVVHDATPPEFGDALLTIEVFTRPQPSLPRRPGANHPQSSTL